MTLVVDASMVVAALVDSGTDGRWAEALLADSPLAAPRPPGCANSRHHGQFQDAKLEPPLRIIAPREQSRRYSDCILAALAS